jgi:hypothetical protein
MTTAMPTMSLNRMACFFVTLALSAGWVQAQTVQGTADLPTMETKAKKKSRGKVHKPKHAAQADDPLPTVNAAAVQTELPADLRVIADQIHVGRLLCEMGQVVTLQPDAQASGRFSLFIQNQVYQMTPVHSATGALRLEDTEKGAVWIQLADKSMLMNSQLGQRMADLCQSPAQQQVAQAHKLAPPPHLLEPLPGSGLAQK